MPSAAIQRYWDSLSKQCVCGKSAEHLHHIIHVNGQRISKDDWLVVPLCAGCHQNGPEAVHRLGGDQKFYEATGWNIVHIAVLNRHNYEVRAR